MESRAKLFGHAIHPILIVYPLGLLSTGVIFDVIYLITANPRWATISFWMIAAGIVGGLLAAVFGFIDYLNIPNQTRAKRIGMVHGLTNLGVVVLFAISWWLRSDLPEAPSTLALALSFIGVGGAFLGGWLGGELVERLGVGVAENANLNAPNSLTQPDRNEVRVRERHAA
ncbi:MAG TPA: DUF2231 domain-containing protein [Pyrinomonadaceae bacterium]|nr:DUF2231 domain-containing protein [Pyrinomonadaceae bacterium]